MRVTNRRTKCKCGKWQVRTGLKMITYGGLHADNCKNDEVIEYVEFDLA